MTCRLRARVALTFAVCNAIPQHSTVAIWISEWYSERPALLCPASKKSNDAYVACTIAQANNDVARHFRGVFVFRSDSKGGRTKKDPILAGPIIQRGVL